MRQNSEAEMEVTIGSAERARRSTVHLQSTSGGERKPQRRPVLTFSNCCLFQAHYSIAFPACYHRNGFKYPSRGGCIRTQGCNWSYRQSWHDHDRCRTLRFGHPEHSHKTECWLHGRAHEDGRHSRGIRWVMSCRVGTRRTITNGEQRRNGRSI